MKGKNAFLGFFTRSISMTGVMLMLTFTANATENNPFFRWDGWNTIIWDWSWWVWIVLILGIVLTIRDMKKIKKHKKKSEHPDTKTDEKPKEDHHHHGPSWWARFFSIIVAVICILYLVFFWVPEAKQGVKDWYSNLMGNGEQNESIIRHPRSIKDEVAVTSNGHPITKYADERFSYEFTGESGYTIYIANLDGTNEQQYSSRDKKIHKEGAHLYRFVAKPGTTAILSYTITPGYK